MTFDSPELEQYRAERREFTSKHLRNGRLIARDPGICFGAYTIRGTRLTVAFLRGRYRAGDSAKLLAKEYGLAPRVIRAVMNWRVAI